MTAIAAISRNKSSCKRRRLRSNDNNYDLSTKQTHIHGGVGWTRTLWIVLVAVVVVIVHTTVITAAQMSSLLQQQQHQQDTASQLSCDGHAPISTSTGGKSSNHNHNKRKVYVLQWLIEASGQGAIVHPSSPQHYAACWILHVDAYSTKTIKKKKKDALLQRYALATLHFATTRSNTTQWDWKMAAMDINNANSKSSKNKNSNNNSGLWMSPKHHECHWYGVICDDFHVLLQSKRHVIRLELGWLKLDGLLPRELGLLSYLTELDVHACDLQGVLPHRMLASLSRLQYLRLHMNGFFGALHREISGLTSLKELVLFGNYFASTIPTELAALKHLQVVDVYANQLTGTIPSELAQLSNLHILDVHDNNLVGAVPMELCRNIRSKHHPLQELVVDCLSPNPEVACSCCTKCCRGLPDPKCVVVATGQEAY